MFAFVVIYVVFAIAGVYLYVECFYDYYTVSKYHVIMIGICAIFWPVYLLYLLGKGIHKAIKWFLSLPDLPEPEDEDTGERLTYPYHRY